MTRLPISKARSFSGALDELLKLCVLGVRGIEVVHVVDARNSIRHPYTSAARIVGGRLSYAGG